MEFVANVVQRALSVITRWLRLLGKPSVKSVSEPPKEQVLMVSTTPTPSTVKRFSIPTPMDEEQKLSLLYPPFAEEVRGFLEAARKQYLTVGIFCGLRTFEEQDRLFAQGRTAPGGIVTKARAGHSYHNYGLAVDICFDSHPTESGWQWSWDPRFSWNRLALLGQSRGLESAYFWAQFPESPHFQKTYGFSTQKYLSLYVVGGLPAVWKEVDNIRKN